MTLVRCLLFNFLVGTFNRSKPRKQNFSSLPSGQVPSITSLQNNNCSRRPRTVDVLMLFLSMRGSTPRGPWPMLNYVFLSPSDNLYVRGEQRPRRQRKIVVSLEPILVA